MRKRSAYGGIGKTGQEVGQKRRSLRGKSVRLSVTQKNSRETNIFLEEDELASRPCQMQMSGESGDANGTQKSSQRQRIGLLPPALLVRSKRDRWNHTTSFGSRHRQAPRKSSTQ
ncbi:hypothetical protein TRVL_08992 [Trypanosoma vivax]|nr:hypothetical protein TRVL_08992 [Trypanosoma vivax]